MSIALIHKYLGESLITLSILGLLITLFVKGPEGGTHRLAQIALRLLVILLSLQWLLGVINYFTIPAVARPSLAHPLIMTVVVAASHILAGKAKSAPASGKGIMVGIFVGAAVLMWIGMGMV